MSRRRRANTEDAAPPREDAPPPDGSPTGSILRDVAILIAVFAIAVGVAELAGAANLGVAFGVGQIALALALIVLLTRE
jgi:hypothetical protein